MKIKVTKEVEVRVFEITYDDEGFSETIAAKNAGQALKKFDDIYGDQVDIEDIAELALDDLKFNVKIDDIYSGKIRNKTALSLLKEKLGEGDLPIVICSKGDC
jgi:hypothetical protein